jgi:hypothetical protein
VASIDPAIETLEAGRGDVTWAFSKY